MNIAHIKSVARTALWKPCWFSTDIKTKKRRRKKVMWILNLIPNILPILIDHPMINAPFNSVSEENILYAVILKRPVRLSTED